MHTTTTTPSFSTNRPATCDEMERAHHALMAFTGLVNERNSNALKLEMALVKKGLADADSPQRPLVVRDFFGAIDSPAEFLLVAPGSYDVPAEFFRQNKDRCIIGLPWQKAAHPTLRIEGLPWQKSGSMNAQNSGPETVPHVVDASSLRLANLQLDAEVPTVLEIDDLEIAGGFLTGLHQHVQYSANIEVLDSLGDQLCIGRDWARAAYGPQCSVRHQGIKLLEDGYMGIMAGVDGIFKPLVDVAGRIDRMLGWK